jgi:hypothetical protein
MDTKTAGFCLRLPDSFGTPRHLDSLTHRFTTYAFTCITPTGDAHIIEQYHDSGIAFPALCKSTKYDHPCHWGRCSL